MDNAQFRDWVERHGADIAVWPEALRADATAWLSRSIEARHLVESHQALDSALRSLPEIRAPRGLVDRIMARATESTAAVGAR